MRAAPSLALPWLLLAPSLLAGACRVDPYGDSGTVGEESDADTDADADGDADADTDTDSDTLDHGCGTGTGAAQVPVGHLVILVTDGARIDETFSNLVSVTNVEEDSADFWPSVRAELLDQGTLVLPAYASGATITGEGHAAILTGVREAQPTWPSDEGPGLYRPIHPTLFELVRAAWSAPESSALLISNTVHLSGHTWSLYPGLGEDEGSDYDYLTEEGSEVPLGTDTGVLDGLWSHMESTEIRVAMANLHQMDRSGHYGAPTAYGEDVKAVDAALVEFWDEIQADPTYQDDTVLVIVADHGRHRWEEETDPPDYKNHGDECVGCRQIPLLILGPGVREGAVITSARTLEDVGATAQWLLGAPSPMAEGQVICDALVDPPATSGRSGEVHPAARGALSASQEWQEDPDHKSIILADGEQLSSADALHAEAPQVTTDGDRDVACWRELFVDQDATFELRDSWPWLGRCLTRTSAAPTWTDISPPFDEVSPYFNPAIELDSGGRIWMAMVDNHTGNWESPDQAIRLLRWTDARGWEGETKGTETAAFAIDPSLALVDDTAFVAIATSADQDSVAAKNAGRFTRHPEVWRVTWAAGGQPTWSRVFTKLNPWNDPEAPWERMEKPAIVSVGGGLHLAFIAWPPDGSATIAVASSEDGATWTEPAAIDTSGRVIGAVTPAWSEDGELYWTRSTSGGTVELCRSALGEETPDCTDTGALAAMGLAVEPDGPVLSLQWGDGAWQLERPTW